MTTTLPEKNLELISQEAIVGLESRRRESSSLPISALAVASSVVLLPVVAAAEYSSSFYDSAKRSPLTHRVKDAVSKEASQLSGTFAAFKRGRPRLKL